MLAASDGLPCDGQALERWHVEESNADLPDCGRAQDVDGGRQTRERNPPVLPATVHSVSVTADPRRPDHRGH